MNRYFVWMVLVELMVISMVIVGGITRLTQSGLSMVEWHLIMGMFPPITDGQWQRLFAIYQEYPQYLSVNQWMGLDEFKRIFFWEYVHRVLGRLVGLAILLPYIWWLFRGQLSRVLQWRGAVMVFLVSLQGGLGWWMVKSGLLDMPHVSHFRLAIHLGMAFFLFQWVWWMILDETKPCLFESAPNWAKRSVFFVFLLSCLQIVYGAFVAGLRAGYGYNTFPKMGDVWVPNSIWMLSTPLRNMMYNPFMIQFIHRWLGIILAVSVAVALWKVWPLFSQYGRRVASFVLGAVGVQVVLGILTLVLSVPLGLAICHQVMALCLLTGIVTLVYGTFD